MRALRVPLFILLALLILSLAHSAAMGRRCRTWLEAAAAADAAAAREQWEQAAGILEDMEKSWNGCRLLLRITLSHQTLDQARSLLERSKLACRLEAGQELRQTLAELASLLRQIDAGERVSWENIL